MAACTHEHDERPASLWGRWSLPVFDSATTRAKEHTDDKIHPHVGSLPLPDSEARERPETVQNYPPVRTLYQEELARNG